MQLKIGKKLTTLLVISSYVYLLNLSVPSSVALADEPPSDYIVRYIPSGHACGIAGQNYRCFTLDESKQLIIADYHLSLSDKVIQEKNAIIQSQTQIIVDKDKQLELSIDNYTIVANDRDRLSDKWAKTDEQLQNASADKDWWRSVAFIGTGVGILVGVIGGYTLHTVLSK